MQQTPSLIQFLPLFLMCVPTAIVAYALAKTKGRNTILWTFLGIVPLVNIFCTWYLVGATNLIMEEKIDRILQHMEGANDNE